jgi:hypothetical protein
MTFLDALESFFTYFHIPELDLPDDQNTVSLGWIADVYFSK